MIRPMLEGPDTSASSSSFRAGGEGKVSGTLDSLPDPTTVSALSMLL